MIKPVRYQHQGCLHFITLRYIHRNPVKRGLVARPEDWPWSSFRHYATGEEGIVEIESEWTARKRERFGLPIVVKPTLPQRAQEGWGNPSNGFVRERWAGSQQTLTQQVMSDNILKEITLPP